MSTLEQAEKPGVLDLDGLESLLDLVFAPDEPALARNLPSSGVPESYDSLKSRLSVTEGELESTRAKLEAANFRLGYMEAVLCSRNEEIARLNARMRRGSRWSGFMGRMFGFDRDQCGRPQTD